MKMNKKELLKIPMHLTTEHMDNKSIYINFIKNYAEYDQIHFIESDLMKKYADIFFSCDTCGEYFNFYNTHLSLLKQIKEEQEEPVKIVGEIDLTKFKIKNTVIDEIKQLAAAGTNIKQWFEEPIDFRASGIFLDIRQIKGEKEKVSIYLKSSQQDYNNPPSLIEIEKTQNTLAEYAGKNIGLIISNNHHSLLEANIYISSDATQGEGSGRLIAQKNDSLISLRLEIFVN